LPIVIVLLFALCRLRGNGARAGRGQRDKKKKKAGQR